MVSGLSSPGVLILSGAAINRALGYKEPRSDDLAPEPSLPAANDARRERHEAVAQKQAQRTNSLPPHDAPALVARGQLLILARDRFDFPRNLQVAPRAVASRDRSTDGHLL